MPNEQSVAELRGINKKMSFPCSVERESRVLLLGAGFRLKDLPTGRQAAGMTYNGVYNQSRRRASEFIC